MQELKDQLSQIAGELNKKLEALEDGAKGADKSVQNLWAEFRKANEELNAKHNRVAEKLKALELSGADSQPESLEANLYKAFKENEERLKKMVDYGGDRIQLKNIFSSSANLGTAPNTVLATRTPATTVYGSPTRRLRVRDILPTGTSDTTITEVVRETAKVGAPTAVSLELVGASDAKPETENNFEQHDFKRTQLAHLKRLPLSWLTDYPAVVSYINSIAVPELLTIEDTQLIAGNGTSPNLRGIAATSGITAFNPGLTVAAPNISDILLYASAQLAQTGINGGGYIVDFIALSPMDHARMLGTKKSDGEYLHPTLFSQDGMSFMGIPVIPHNAIPAGKILLGDSNQCQIQFVGGLSVELFREDRDNVVRNLFTLRVEESLKFPIYQPAGFMYIDIAAAITTLTA